MHIQLRHLYSACATVYNVDSGLPTKKEIPDSNNNSVGAAIRNTVLSPYGVRIPCRGRPLLNCLLICSRSSENK